MQSSFAKKIVTNTTTRPHLPLWSISKTVSLPVASYHDPESSRVYSNVFEIYLMSSLRIFFIRYCDTNVLESIVTIKTSV